RLALAGRLGDPLPALAHPPRRRPEGAVELALAVDRPHDRAEIDRLQPQPALAAAPERLDDLLERKDHVDVARLAPQRGGHARHRPAPAGAAEVELSVGLG